LDPLPIIQSQTAGNPVTKETPVEQPFAELKETVHALLTSARFRTELRLVPSFSFPAQAARHSLPFKQLVVGACDFDAIDFFSLWISDFDLQIRMLTC